MNKLTKATKELLTFINTWAEKNAVDNTSIFEAWNILSALRGPDEENSEYKRDFTWPIRKAALGRFVEVLSKHTWQGHWYGDFLRASDTIQSKAIPIGHFGMHVGLAAEALGILSEDG